MKRISYSTEHLAEAIQAWDPEYRGEVQTIPTVRGSVALAGNRSESVVIKCATLANQQTEIDINPPRSVGIRNEASHQLSLPPGIAPHLIAYVDRSDVVFTVTECYQGQNLGTLSRRGDVSTGLSRWLIHSMILEAGKLHNAGALHGDWHPENLMVTEQRWLRPLDFEFAHALEDDAFAPGLAHYLSPSAAQQIIGHEAPLLDQREEVFAVAASALSVLTAAYPHAYSRPGLSRIESLGEIATVSRYTPRSGEVSADNLALAHNLAELLEAPLGERPSTPSELYKEISPCL